jgi:glycosyltransferase involved in cell wall biosynthesis
MKVIFVTREGQTLPGARIRCYNFAKELIKYGIDATVFSYADTLGAKDGARESQIGLREKIGLNYKAFLRLAKDRKTILYIQRFNYHSLAPYLAHLFNGNKIILDLDDWEMREDPDYYFGFYPSSKAHYLTRQIARRSIFCIAASRFLEQFLSEFNSRVYYIPSGVDTELFCPEAGREERKKIVFSWIGTFHKNEYVENIRFALDCFCRLRKQYSHIYLEILGDGIHKEAVKESIEESRDQNVSLRDWINPERVPGYLAEVDVGLLPVVRDSKFNRAKSPAKLFEYMAMAKPSVSSNIGEAGEIIRDGDNGFLAGGKEEFIDKMKLLVEDQDLRRHIGNKARQTIESYYSLKILGRQLSDLFKDINA